MGRKTQITKEQMLEAGLQIVIRDGYDAVSIKTVAHELQCSTHPIAWSFGNIDNYRGELHKYALDYMMEKMRGDGVNPALDHKRTGEVYVDMAIEQPNLIRYLRTDWEAVKASGGMGLALEEETFQIVKERWAETLGVSEERALEFMRFGAVFTEGLVALILAGGISVDKDTAQHLLEHAGEAYTAFIQSRDREG